MQRSERQRLTAAESELSDTLSWIVASDNSAASEDARGAIVRLSTELRERYSLVAPSEDPAVHEFHVQMDAGMHARWAYVHPRILRHYEDRHFTMIRGVGERYASHIRWLLGKSGIGRDPQTRLGILHTPISSLKTSPERVHWLCPDDMRETTLAELQGLSLRDALERFAIQKRERPFIEQMLKVLDIVQ